MDNQEGKACTSGQRQPKFFAYDGKSDKFKTVTHDGSQWQVGKKGRKILPC